MVQSVKLSLQANDPALQPFAVGAQLGAERVGVLVVQLKQPPYLGYREFQVAQYPDQARLSDLVVPVASVAAFGVDRCRCEQANRVVMPERLGGQPAGPGELPDAQQLVRCGHAADRKPSRDGKVNWLSFSGC